MDYAQFVVFAVIIGISYMIWETYINGEVEFVKSTVDQKDYQVRSLPDKQEAADMLARIRQRFETLVKHLEKTKQDDPRTLRLVRNFNAQKISEGSESSKYTSYSVNKGEKIVFCLRSKDAQKKLSDINTLMFVGLHEIAHVATESVGHTKEFWDTFKWILEESMNIGIYQKQDFKQKPVPYCGMTITDSPLDRP